MKKGLSVFALLFSGVATAAAPNIGNMALLRKTFDVAQYDDTALSNVKIAILDAGFQTLAESATEKTVYKDKTESRTVWSIAKDRLPPSAKLVVSYDYVDDKGELLCPSQELLDNPHGAVMAETVWAMTNRNPAGPQFFLLNANGERNFYCAVQYAREQKVDIILHSMTYAWGGSFRGDGLINDIVNEATADGILWINAAGNDANRTYTGKVEEKEFRIANYSQSLVTALRVSLSWAAPGSNAGTDKDLDLEITDADGNALPVQNHRQVLKKSLPKPKPQSEEVRAGEKEESVLSAPQGIAAPGTDTPETNKAEGAPEYRYVEDADGRKILVDDEEAGDLESTQASEVANIRMKRVDPGQYYRIRVRIKGGKFNESDRMRLTISSDPVPNEAGPQYQLLEASGKQEINIPADNPNVITVGDTDRYGSRGPTMDGRQKPEIIMKTSEVDFAGTPSGGTSQAAAILAGIVVQLKAQEPRLNRESVLRFVLPGQGMEQNNRRPMQGYLPEGAELSSLEIFKVNHPHGTEILDYIRQYEPNLVLEAYVHEGNFILASIKPPVYLNRPLFKSRTVPQNVLAQGGFGYYLVYRPGAQRVDWSIHNQRLQQGRRFDPPWETATAKDAGLTQRDFVEIRQVRYTQERIPGARVKNLWTTPTPSELREIVGEQRD